MIKTKAEIQVKEELNTQGGTLMTLANLKEFEGINQNLKMFSHVKLFSGQEVSYHLHERNSELYYILSGNGTYNDNGEEMDINAGTVTFTPSGSSHGIKNTGDGPLEFIALIIND